MNLTQELDCLLDPRSVALIGASNFFGKWGYNILSRLLSGVSRREVYAVNQKEAEIQGRRVYSSILDIPGPVDVAVITVPFPELCATMNECVQKGVRGAVVISSGLAETGVEGAEIEREAVRIARRGRIRFVGPNCLGVFDPYSDFCTIGFLPPVKKGNAALISQSGNSGQSILNYGLQMGLGFSKFISSGNEADLRFEDYVEYLAEDERTEMILGYVEGLRDGGRFLRLAREITRIKPIVIMKAGRTDVGSRAARSHSAALAGSDAVLDAAFRQCGVIRVGQVEELVEVAVALLGQPLPRGRRVGVLSMGGGMAVTVADALRKEGLELPPLSPATMGKLDSFLSSRWSRGNPVDPAGDFVSYHCLWPLIEDEGFDAILTVGGFGMAAGFPGWAPPSMKVAVDRLSGPIDDAELENLEKTFELMEKYRKPLIFTSGVTAAAGRGKVFKRLKQTHRNLYSSPEAGAKVLAHLADYADYLRAAAEDRG